MIASVIAVLDGSPANVPEIPVQLAINGPDIQLQPLVHPI